MLPQVNGTTSTTKSVLEIPSRTYKLNIDTGNYVTFTNDANLPTFEIQNGDLIVTYTSTDPTFSIHGYDLFMNIADPDAAGNYQLIEDCVYYDGNFYCDDRIMGYVDNLEAIKQLVYHILMTERYSYLIYSNNYGVEFDQYKGKPFSYLEMTIENTLKEALTYDLRIKNVQVDSTKQVGDYAIVNFTVYSIYGNLQMEVSIVV